MQADVCMVYVVCGPLRRLIVQRCMGKVHIHKEACMCVGCLPVHAYLFKCVVLRSSTHLLDLCDPTVRKLLQCS